MIMIDLRVSAFFSAKLFFNDHDRVINNTVQLLPINPRLHLPLLPLLVLQLVFTAVNILLFLISI